MSKTKIGLPTGFDHIRAAIVATGINASTDMSIDAMRADARRLADACANGMPPPPRNRGRYTGLRTYDFQNTLYFANDTRGWGFTDRTLAIVWAVELPSNRCDFIAHHGYIGSTRTAYVHGRHGSNVVDPTTFASAVYTAPKPAAKRATGGRRRVAVAADVAVPDAAIESAANVAAIGEPTNG